MGKSRDRDKVRDKKGDYDVYRNAQPHHLSTKILTLFIANIIYMHIEKNGIIFPTGVGVDNEEKTVKHTRRMWQRATHLPTDRMWF